MSSKRSISKKVILIGSFCVGKTSLISSFVYRKFPFIYQTTLGVRIDKKVVELDDLNLNMIIWDIGGEQNQSRIPQSYYLGSDGVIYVFDLTRPSSFFNIEEDLKYINDMLPGVPVIVTGNKSDLLDEKGLAETENILPVKPDIYSSAKTGKNVDIMFDKLANKML